MNRKQAVSLFLAVLIMGTRIGFALNIHYCGTHIAEISLASSPSDCGMEGSSKNQNPENPSFAKASCCADETVLYQNHEPQKVEIENSLPFFDSLYLNFEQLEQTYRTNTARDTSKITYIPPPRRKIKIYLLNQSFIVYG